MSSEEQEMLQRISALAGQINRHKNQQNTTPVRQPNPYHPSNAYPAQNSWRSGRAGYAPYSTRGRGYAARGKPVIPHRNRTLILNGTTGAQTGDNISSPDASGASTPTQSWVSKSDRHLQLINPSVYEKQSQDRAKAIEETRIRRIEHKNQRERIKLANHLHLATVPNGASVERASTIHPTGPQFVFIDGIRFKVSKGGSKLIRVDGIENLGLNTPKTGIVGGVTFHRSKTGNMYRSGVVKAQRHTGIVKKVNELCKVFSTTGSCPKGPKCRFIHNPTKLAVCKDFMLKGVCSSGDDCDLSHDLTSERTPTCLHFTKGNCTNSSCRYTHVHVSPSAPLCRAFGIYGFCDSGSTCPDRHIMSECPDYSNTGVCKTKGCRLIHRDRATIMRRHAVEAEANGADGGSDLSSDEDEIDSDDVDSDDMEFFGDDDEKDLDIPTQQDFVRLNG